MPVLPDNRGVWRFLMSNMFSSELVEELKGRHVLHWNYRNYEILPQELLVFGLHAEELYLKGNKLRLLPTWLSALSHLTSLYLEGNGLRELPSTIGACQMLDAIDIQDNELEELPESFCHLRNLTVLNLRGNRIRKLPRGFDNLKALAILNMSNNKLKVLPECVCELRSLQELILDNNELRRLPGKIVLLRNLCYLSVNKNYLEYLPLQLFVSHASITFSHNPTFNYVQYDLGCDLSRNSFVATGFDNDEAWRMDITGCSSRQIEFDEASLFLITHDDNTILKLPPEFRKIHQDDKTAEASTLFELALRQSHEVIAQLHGVPNSDVEYTWNIPSIGRLLKGGPTARCSNVECSEAIFTESVAWVMKIPVSNGEGPTRTLASPIFFCSTRCAREFARGHSREASLRIKWTLM